MKRVILLLPLLIFAFFSAVDVLAQAPARFNYQAVARKPDKTYFIGPITVKIDILDVNNVVVFTETQSTTANEYGLFSVEIGKVNTTLGSVQWASGSKFVRVTVNNVVIGNAELLSVPYALYAGNSTSGTTNTIRNGTTPPDPNLGNDGDFYIDNNNLMIYGPRVAGAWPAGKSIKGTGSGSNKIFKGVNGVKIDSLSVPGTYTFSNTLTIDSLNTSAFVKSSTTPGPSNVNQVLVWDGNLWSFQHLNGTSTPVTVGAGLTKNGGNNIRLNIDGSLDTTGGTLKVTKSRLDTLAGGPLTDNYVIKVVGGKLQLAPDDTSGTQGNGITNLNDQTAAIQTLDLDTSATDFGLTLSMINPGTVNQHLGLPTLSNNSKTDRGLLSKSDYDKLIGGVGNGTSYTSKSLIINADTIGLAAGGTKGNVMTWDGGKWISTSTGVGYVVGSSLLLKTGNILVADSNKAIWNASRLLSKPISKPVGGQYLSYDALKDSIVFVPAPSGTSQWVPYTGSGIGANGGIQYTGEVYIDDTLDVLNVIKTTQIRTISVNATEDINAKNLSISKNLVSLDSIVTDKFRVKGGSIKAGRVLTSDSRGIATWQDLPGGSGGGGYWDTIPNIGITYKGGNVGIGGSASTKYKLEVTGKTALDNLYVGGPATIDSLADIRFMKFRGDSYQKRIIGSVLTALDTTGNVGWTPASPSNGWGLSGNITSKTDFIGTTNIQSLRFRTDNKLRMTIDSASGFVGIGVDKPVNSLTVNGGINIDFDEKSTQFAIKKQNGPYLLFGKADTREGITSQQDFDVNGNGNVNGLDFFTNNITALSIAHNGHIGLAGISNPTHYFHVGPAFNNGGPDQSTKYNVRFQAYGGKGDRSLYVDNNGVVKDTVIASGSGASYTQGRGIVINSGKISAGYDSVIWNAAKMVGLIIDTVGGKKTGNILTYKNGKIMLAAAGSGSGTSYTKGPGIKNLNGNIITADTARAIWDAGKIGNNPVDTTKTLFPADKDKVLRWDGSKWVAGNDSLVYEPVNQLLSIKGSNTVMLKSLGTGGSSLLQGSDIRIISGRIHLDRILDSTLSINIPAAKNFNIIGTASQKVLIDSVNAGVKLGIGVANPQSKVHTSGGFRSDSLRGIGKRLLIARPNGLIDTLNNKTGGGVLTSDGSGNFSWSAASASGWSLSGNVLTPTSYLGSSAVADTNSLRFATQGAIRARINSAGKMGIGGLPLSNATLAVYGNMVTGNLSAPSDIRYKKNVSQIGSALETVQKLTGVSYNWRRDEFPQMNFMEGKDLGLIAQEVEKVLPELVMTDDKGFKTVRYTQLIPVLLEAIKEQQKQIEALKIVVSAKDNKVQSSESRIQSLESSMKTLNSQMQLLMEVMGSKDGVKASK